jgi:adenine-specific DNA-methyltransferase
MGFKIIKPKKQLKKSYLNQTIQKDELLNFKSLLFNYIKQVKISSDNKQTEEHNKTELSKFLNESFYKNKHYINTKSYKGNHECDLVIHSELESTSQVSVLLEVKQPNNVGEMISKSDFRKKSFYEIILYYLWEKEKFNNDEVQNLVITDHFQWFVFSSKDFYRLFFTNKSLITFFNKWREGTTDSSSTNQMYSQIEKIVNDLTELPCVYFNLQDITKITDEVILEEELITIYKYLNPVSLLNQSFENDSNSLDPKFYSELLHILGLEEKKKDGKWVIIRKEERDSGSIIENTILKIQSEGLLDNIDDLTNYGKDTDEQLFSISLELSITWINRIIFLKLLETQLGKYHREVVDYSFLNSKKIKEFNQLNTLFFEVLNERPGLRKSQFKTSFSHIPYLNSSLFETTDLERHTVRISNLDDTIKLKVSSKTILTDEKGNYLRNIELPTILYLLDFLDSYNFGLVGKENVQDKVKTIINSSVLGLIFEKINGYKDGSIYTPSYITMYMSRDTLRQRVVELFNERFSLGCKSFKDLYNKIDRVSIKDSNELINGLKICDPSVGSGHFLVSCLNEILCIKSELGILIDEDENRIKDYSVKVENDELIVEDEDGNQFEYLINSDGKPSDKRQKVQKTLFNEKRRIIENSLFGVDINPNSVKICRLRLWIELLKNSYYTKESNYKELQTLPNIDINIKRGNSLISRVSLSEELDEVFSQTKYSIDEYKNNVFKYKETNEKEDKKKLEKYIKGIKEEFNSTIDNKLKGKENKLFLEMNVLKTKLETLVTMGLEVDEKEKKKLKLKENQLKIVKEEIEEILTNKIYKTGFEWRFEFPEVLKKNGDFEGFDIIIGNPPYIKENDDKKVFEGLRKLPCYQGKMDIWNLFGCLGFDLLKKNGLLNFISTNNWVTNSGSSNFRNSVTTKTKIESLIDFGSIMIFKDVSIQTMIMKFRNNSEYDNYTFDYRRIKSKVNPKTQVDSILNLIDCEGVEVMNPVFSKEKYTDKNFIFSTDNNDLVLNKIIESSDFKIENNEVFQGIVPNPDVVNSRNIKKFPDSKIKKHNIKVGDGVFVLPINHFKKLSKEEKKYIKPVYEPKNVDRYYLGENELEMIYLTKSNYKNDSPTLKSHLEKYKEIMEERRENQNGRLKYYHLHWSRDEDIFKKGEKILSVRKCSEPTFVYTKEETFVMMSFNVIKTERVDMKYLTGLLNSTLIKYWLKTQGKRQGDMYQIDSDPIMELPLKLPDDKTKDKIIKYVEEIIEKKSSDSKIKTTKLEEEIDKLVFSLYNLQKEDVEQILKEIQS